MLIYKRSFVKLLDHVEEKFIFSVRGFITCIDDIECKERKEQACKENRSKERFELESMCCAI